MEKQFFIFIGRSGAGKGTQSDLLKDYLVKQKSQYVVHITTGGNFRSFIKEDNYVANLAKETATTGGLQPEFLAVWNWADIFIKTLTGNETIILDGAPRRPFEVAVLHSAVTFFGYKKPIVIYLDVPETVSKSQIVSRGRDDDKNENEITSRMNWFETDVLPTLALYLNDPRYKVLHINGSQPIEIVHEEIVSKYEEYQLQ